MNVLDYIWLSVVQYLNDHDLTPIYGFTIAFVVSALQTKKHGTFKLVESLLCGVFAAIAWVSIPFLGASIGIGLPAGAYAVLSGTIGWFGTDAVVEFLKARLNWGGQK